MADDRTSFFRLLFAAFFIASGITHFIMTDFYLRMMPPYLPFHSELILISGILEISFALLLLLPQTRGIAGIGLILLLIAVFPANLHMALYPEIFPYILPIVLWLRLPIQIIFIYWAWKLSRPSRT